MNEYALRFRDELQGVFEFIEVLLLFVGLPRLPWSLAMTDG